MIEYVMHTLYESLEKAAISRKYEDLYDFIISEDSKARGYVTQMRECTRIPSTDRLTEWAIKLKMNAADSAAMIRLAEIDRVRAAAKRNKALGRGLNLILEELDLLRSQVAKFREQVRDVGSKQI